MKPLLFFLFFCTTQIKLTAQETVPLYRGVAPGSENWTWQEQEFKVGGNACH